MEDKFDVNSLPEEAKKYIDQKINSGVQTGIKNAEEKFKNDENLRATIEKEIKEKIEAEAKMDAEEKAKVILEEATKKAKEANLKNNRSEAKDLFSEAGISKETYSEFLDILIDEDTDKTKAKVTSFIEKFNKSVEEKTNKELAKNLKDMNKPNKSDDDSSKKLEPKETDITKMKFEDLAKLRTENPDKYKELMQK